MTWIQQAQQASQTPITLEWIRSLSTLAAVLVALAIALWGETLRRVFYKPDLQLEAEVRRPDAEGVGRQTMLPHAPALISVGEAWFFRLAISNLSKTPARDVQVYLKRVEKADGTVVEKFTPMNLLWSNKGIATRPVLLRELPIFCDFIHISDPTYRLQHGENLNEVPTGKAIMCLDVEATNSAKGHLTRPRRIPLLSVRGGRELSGASFHRRGAL